MNNVLSIGLERKVKTYYPQLTRDFGDLYFLRLLHTTLWDATTEIKCHSISPALHNVKLRLKKNLVWWPSGEKVRAIDFARCLQLMLYSGNVDGSRERSIEPHDVVCLDDYCISVLFAADRSLAVLPLIQDLRVVALHRDDVQLTPVPALREIPSHFSGLWHPASAGEMTPVSLFNSSKELPSLRIESTPDWELACELVKRGKLDIGTPSTLPNVNSSVTPSHSIYTNSDCLEYRLEVDHVHHSLLRLLGTEVLSDSSALVRSASSLGPCYTRLRPKRLQRALRSLEVGTREKCSRPNRVTINYANFFPNREIAQSIAQVFETHSIFADLKTFDYYRNLERPKSKFSDCRIRICQKSTNLKRSELPLFQVLTQVILSKRVTPTVFKALKRQGYLN